MLKQFIESVHGCAPVPNKMSLQGKFFIGKLEAHLLKLRPMLSEGKHSGARSRFGLESIVDRIELSGNRDAVHPQSDLALVHAIDALWQDAELVRPVL